MLINEQTFDIGDTITFTSKNPHDTRTWYGKVMGICGYKVASGYSDLINYYQQLVASESSVVKFSKLGDASFILIEVEGVNGNVIQPICPEWIYAPSFKVVKSQVAYTVQVYTHSGETLNDVLQILRDAGFTCKAL